MDPNQQNAGLCLCVKISILTYFNKIFLFLKCMKMIFIIFHRWKEYFNFILNLFYYSSTISAEVTSDSFVKVER